MNDKFIDLCVDDNNSEIGHRMPQQQAAFRAQLEKLNFQFQTKVLDTPQQAGQDGAQATIDRDSMQTLCTADSSMGQQLDEIFDLIDGQAKEQFRHKQVIIEHKWNENANRFDEVAY